LARCKEKIKYSEGKLAKMGKVESESRNKHLKYVLKEKELNALKAKMIEIQ